MILYDFFCILFLLIQFFVSGSLFHSLFIKTSFDADINAIPRILFFGIFLNITFLQIWHLFLPINLLCSLVIHSIQLFFIYYNKNSLKYLKIFKTLSLKSYFLFFLFLLWISGLTNSHIRPYDSGLYHLPIINWISSYPIIKGLANLNIWYGINSNLFLLISVTKNYPFYLNFLWGFNGVFLCIGFLSFFIIPFEYITQMKKKNTEIFYRSIFLIPFIHYSFYYFPGTYTDLPIFIIGCVLSIEFFLLITNKTSYHHIIPILVFLGISIKTSFLFFGIGVLIIYIIKIYLIKSHIKVYFLKLSFGIFIVSSIIWMSRGVILSGYPLLPLSSISVPVSWRMDIGDASVMRNSLDNKEIVHGEDLKLIDLLSSKLKVLKGALLPQHRKLEMFYPTIFGLIGLVYVLKFKKRMNYIILFPILIQFLIWFVIPKNRYSSFAAWWLCSHYFSLILEDISSIKHTKYIFLLILIFSISLHKIDYLGQEKIFFPKYTKKIIPKADIKSFKTSSGFEIFTLEDESEDQCWESDLLCTRFPNKKLRPYDENDLSKGFYTIKID